MKHARSLGFRGGPFVGSVRNPALMKKLKDIFFLNMIHINCQTTQFLIYMYSSKPPRSQKYYNILILHYSIIYYFIIAVLNYIKISLGKYPTDLKLFTCSFLLDVPLSETITLFFFHSLL